MSAISVMPVCVFSLFLGWFRRLGNVPAAGSVCLTPDPRLFSGLIEVNVILWQSGPGLRAAGAGHADDEGGGIEQGASRRAHQQACLNSRDKVKGDTLSEMISAKGTTMRESTTAIRDHLVRALDWEDARVGFDKAVDGIPADKRGRGAAGFEHSLWQLVEHIRTAQEDILDFCVNANYEHSRKWPDDYWPTQPAPVSEQAWSDNLASYKRSLQALKQLTHDVDDLTATVPTGKAGQTYLRAILLVVDHTAYHVGQVVDVRRALGIWK